MNNYKYFLSVNGKIIDLNSLGFPYDMTDYLNLTLLIGSFESRDDMGKFFYDAYLTENPKIENIKMLISVKRNGEEFYKPISDIHNDKFLSSSTIKYFDINSVKSFYKKNINNKNILENLGNFYLVENVKKLSIEEKSDNLNYLKHLKNENIRLNNYLKIVRTHNIDEEKINKVIDLVIDTEVLNSSKNKTVNMRKLASLTKQMILVINGLVRSKRKFYMPDNSNLYDEKLNEISSYVDGIIYEKSSKVSNLNL